MSRKSLPEESKLKDFEFKECKFKSKATKKIRKIIRRNIKRGSKNHGRKELA